MNMNIDIEDQKQKCIYCLERKDLNRDFYESNIRTCKTCLLVREQKRIRKKRGEIVHTTKYLFGDKLLMNEGCDYQLTDRVITCLIENDLPTVIKINDNYSINLDPNTLSNDQCSDLVRYGHSYLFKLSKNKTK